uniref:hypothetical protein n=1 Tax=Eubacterium cellulosolvens TaxID=29322 RepID=UPI00048631BC|nr:hypothetical protein [[Eubacterium] cellulosolvens]
MTGAVIYPGPNMLHLCIDSYTQDRREIGGTITGVAIPDICEFVSTQDMLVKIDQLLDMAGRPQATTLMRSNFKSLKATEEEPQSAPGIYHSINDIIKRKGQLATYNIIFHTRYHSSLQGSVYTNDGTKKGEFASELELLHILEII